MIANPAAPYLLGREGQETRHLIALSASGSRRPALGARTSMAGLASSTRSRTR